MLPAVAEVVLVPDQVPGTHQVAEAELALVEELSQTRKEPADLADEFCLLSSGG